MRIDGKKIATEILDDLKQKVAKLKRRGVTPHLHIVTLTIDAASNAYVSQKKLKGTEIGVEITVENVNPKTTTSQLLQKIKTLNTDSKVHGIIVQRPMPPQISEAEIANSIDPQKDVDGFHPNSNFMPPVALSVLRILEEVYKTQTENLSFNEILKAKKITVIGRGVTAGGPIISTLKKLEIEPEIITSKTEDKEKIIKNSDIVITAVGKSNIIKGENLKNGAILIGVGMYKDEAGKFRSDYDEDDIKDKVSFYTPTPGGVGPINVAMLLSNLLKTTEKN